MFDDTELAAISLVLQQNAADYGESADLMREIATKARAMMDDPRSAASGDTLTCPHCASRAFTIRVSTETSDFRAHCRGADCAWSVPMDCVENVVENTEEA